MQRVKASMLASIAALALRGAGQSRTPCGDGPRRLAGWDDKMSGKGGVK